MCGLNPIPQLLHIEFITFVPELLALVAIQWSFLKQLQSQATNTCNTNPCCMLTIYPFPIYKSKSCHNYKCLFVKLEVDRTPLGSRE